MMSTIFLVGGGGGVSVCFAMFDSKRHSNYTFYGKRWFITYSVMFRKMGENVYAKTEL